MTFQIFWGSLLLGVCSVIHLVLMVGWVGFLIRSVKGNAEHSRQATILHRMIVFLAGTFLVIVVSHTLQVWLWAWVLLALGALSTLNDALYFSLVTYTTVGYGDVVLPNAFRIFGAMASVTGLLNFGISTAILVDVVSRVFRFEERGKT